MNDPIQNPMGSVSVPSTSSRGSVVSDDPTRLTETTRGPPMMQTQTQTLPGGSSALGPDHDADDGHESGRMLSRELGEPSDDHDEDQNADAPLRMPQQSDEEDAELDYDAIAARAGPLTYPVDDEGNIDSPEMAQPAYQDMPTAPQAERDTYPDDNGDYYDEEGYDDEGDYEEDEIDEDEEGHHPYPHHRRHTDVQPTDSMSHVGSGASQPTNISTTGLPKPMILPGAGSGADTAPPVRSEGSDEGQRFMSRSDSAPRTPGPYVLSGSKGPVLTPPRVDTTGTRPPLREQQTTPVRQAPSGLRTESPSRQPGSRTPVPATSKRVDPMGPTASSDSMERQDGGRVEPLMPVDSSRPVERFFVHYDDRGGAGDALLLNEQQPVDENERVLEHFAEYTDDDSFFSSSSEVVEVDPRRLQCDPGDNRATLSVQEALTLRLFTGGRVPEEEQEQELMRTSWIYQIHHRDIALMSSSFFVFPPRMTARVVVYNLLHHWAYEVYLLFAILSYAIFQASWGRYGGQPLAKPDFMRFADVFYTVLFGVELVLRLFAYGCVLHKRSFFRSPWHWLDTAVVVLMVMNCTGWHYLWNFTAWRLLRLIKCFTYVPMPIRMKLMAKALLRSTNQLAHVSVLLIYGIFFFGLMGLQLFNGAFRARCVHTLSGQVTNQLCRTVATGQYRFYWGFACADGFHCAMADFGNPYFGYRHFDNIGHAMLSTFQIMTFQNWTGLMNDTSDTVALLAFLYYAMTILFLAYFIPNLVIGVFIEKLEKTNRLFIIKQLRLFNAMLVEQKQRINAGIKLKDFVERDERGYIRRLPEGPDRGTDPNGANADTARKFRKTKWTDEQRVMLHLSLTRQKDVADDAERKRQRVRKSELPESTSRIAAASSAIGPVKSSTPATSRPASAGKAAPGHHPISPARSGQGYTVASGRPPMVPSAFTGVVPTPVPRTEGDGGKFALGGRVGSVQHHMNQFSSDPSRPSLLPLSKRLDVEQERLRFLNPYTPQHRSATPDTLARTTSVGRPPRAVSASPSSMRGRPTSATSVGGSAIARLREAPGVIPNRSTLSPTAASRDVSFTTPSRQRMPPTERAMMDSGVGQVRVVVAPADQATMENTDQGPLYPPPENLHVTRTISPKEELLMAAAGLEKDVPVPLQVHDPEGGDFNFADTSMGKLEIIRNIVHMTTEGYPRILSQFLWENYQMQRRYGLTPLNYVNKYEAEAVRKLRMRQRACRDRDGDTDYDDCDDDDDDGNIITNADYGRRSGSDFAGSGRSPVSMAKGIAENAPMTWFQWLYLFLTFANGVFNASRHHDQPAAWDRGLFIVSVIFSALFLLEVLARMVALGPLQYLWNLFNFVDVVVTIISFFELGFGRSNTITVLNWIRCLKLFRVAPITPLRKVTRVLLLGFQECLYGVVFFNVYLFMWLLIGMSFFGSRFWPFELLFGRSFPMTANFDTFSLAFYSVAQAFSYVRDAWLLLSWQGMGSRGGYTVMYFLATAAVSFLFRFLFIAVYTWAWECEEEQDDYGFQRDVRKSRLRWFDFTVWRSFKHIHGGFERREVAPDEVFQLTQDMRRQLRLAEARDRFFSDNYTIGTGEERLITLEERQRHASLIADAPFYNVGGQIQRRVTYQDVEYPTAAQRFAEYQSNNAQLRFARQRTAAFLANGGAATGTGHLPVAYIESDAPSGTTPQKFRGAPGARGEDAENAAHGVNDTNGTVFPGNEDWSHVRHKDGASSATRSVLAPGVDRPRPTTVTMHVVTLATDADARDYRDPTGLGSTELIPPMVAFLEHQLFSGPLFRYKSVGVGHRRVFERCLDCGAHKQMPLPAPPGVERRTANDLHQEHCHMAAVRMSRQLVLNAISGFVMLQIENNIPPSQNAIETVLGQAWSCGMLMFETIENLSASQVDDRGQSWEGVLQALELQQWLLNLRIGEEQVGRATLAYELAHKRMEQRAAEESTAFDKTWRKRSFLVLTPQNPIRRFFIRLVESALFEMFILFVIYAASICLCFYIPFADRSRPKYATLHILDNIFTVIFAVEMVCKWIAQGVVLDVGEAYFWHKWNILDSFIVAISIASWAQPSLGLRYLKVIRCFRILIPMRYFTFNQGLAKLALAMYDSIPTLANILLLCLTNYIVWAILATRLFMGKMSYCADSAFQNRTACLSHEVTTILPGGGNATVMESSRWIPFQRNFDNFYESLLTMFEVSTGSQWLDIFNQGMAAWSSENAPIWGRRPYKALFFIPFYYVSNFLLFSLFIAGMLYCYLTAKNAIEGSWGLTYEQQLWVRVQKMLLRIKPRPGLVPLNNPLSKLLHKVVAHKLFDCTMAVILLFNMITMALSWHGMNTQQSTALDVLQYIWVALFTIEVILRLLAYGTRFFTRWEYCFDLFIVCLSYLQIGLNTTHNHKVPFNVNVLRMLRLGRVLKLLDLVLPFHTHLSVMHRVLLYSAPALVNVSILFVIATYVFAILGMHFAGHVMPVTGPPPVARLTPYPNLPLGLPVPAHDYAGYIDYKYNNFATFPNALIMVFRLATLEGWTSMLRDNLNHVDTCYFNVPCGRSNFAPVFYVSIVICFYLMIVTLYAAVVVDNYVTVFQMEKAISRMEDLRHFVKLWNKHDPHGTLVIPTSKLAHLLEQLRPPLGISRRHNRLELLLLLDEYQIPDHGGKVHFYEVMLPLARRIIAMAFSKDSGDAIVAADYASGSHAGVSELSGRGIFGEEEEFTTSWRISEKTLRALPTLYVGHDVATAAQHFAATYIQAAYRRDKAMREVLECRAEMWEEGRRSCEEQQLPYEQFGFGMLSLADEDPRMEGARGGAEASYLGNGVGLGSPQHGLDEDAILGGMTLMAGQAANPLRSPRAGNHSAAPSGAVSPCRLLPGQYQSAIITERPFGPDVPNAVRRHEKRSDKMRRKQDFGVDGGKLTNASTDPDPPVGGGRLYQPPLGSNPIEWRDMEMNRRTGNATPYSGEPQASTPSSNSSPP